ncbi:MAG: hypothetical protein M3256_02070 [Actinomycetota bacterium]|nr:hypothetical protein [Actinomycetota bacterium]
MASVTLLAATSGMTGMGHHSAAMVGLLYLPILMFVFVMAMQAGTLANIPLAKRFSRGYRTAGPAAQLTALAMAMTATVHLSLAPTHFAEDHALGVLFALNGIAFAAIVLGVYLSHFWRVPALALLTATLLAYGFYILTGRESVDPIGIFTKLVELSAAALIIFGDRSDIILGRLAPSPITEASS